MAYRYQQGRKQLSFAGGGSTDDLGDYRIFGVAPGKYFLSATANNQTFAFAQDRSAAPPPDEDYVLTYYPGTADVATARQWDVTPGARLRAIMPRVSKPQTLHL